MSTTIINALPEQEPPSDPSNLESELPGQIEEEVATVADEILVEVKECREQQRQVMVDLERLRESGEQQTQRYQELLTELRNLREENRNLNSEMKILLERQPSLSSTPSISPLEPAAETVILGPPINPDAVDESPVAKINQEPKKRKRFRI